MFWVCNAAKLCDDYAIFGAIFGSQVL
jgi:hypothetical protein